MPAPSSCHAQNAAYLTRLSLSIAYSAIPRSLVLPLAAHPWQQHHPENKSWVYRFALESRAEIDAAVLLVHAPGLKWDRILALGWGVPIPPHTVSGVLDCLRRSYESEDYRAHCWTGRHATTMEQEPNRIATTFTHNGATQDVYQKNGHVIPSPKKAPIWLHPCRFAGSPPLTTFHPATIFEQIEAGLTAQGCRWCPRLDRLNQWQQQMWGKKDHTPFGPTVLDDGRLR